jgi:hypothetical protein
MESHTALIMLLSATFLIAGVLATSALSPNVWAPTPRPVVESVLLVGRDLLVDVRNPSNRVLRCQVYAGDVQLSGPAEILPGRVASYTGPAVSRYVNIVCGEGRDVRLAYQVPGQGGGEQSQGPSGGGDPGTGASGGPELRHFSCEVRAIGNKKLVRLHVNIQAVVNQGAKPYNFTIDFGDGTVETSIQEGSAYTTNHMYENGEYTASIIVTDALGRTVSSTLNIPAGCRNT